MKLVTFSHENTVRPGVLTAGGEAGLILTVRVHVGEEEYHVQLNGLSEEEAPVVAHQVLAGLRVEG